MNKEEEQFIFVAEELLKYPYFKQLSKNIIHVPNFENNNQKKYVLSYDILMHESQFAKVYDCGQYVTKRISLKNVNQQKIEQTKDFLKTIATNNHQNVIEIIAFCIRRQQLYIIEMNFKYNLAQFSKEHVQLSPNQLKLIVQCVCNGYNNILKHNKKLKIFRPHNVLIDFNNFQQVKVGDIGLREILEDKSQLNAQQKQTQFENMCPQMHSKVAVSNQSNIVWGIGLMYFKLLTRKQPWVDHSSYQDFLKYQTSEMQHLQKNINQYNCQLSELHTQKNKIKYRAQPTKQQKQNSDILQLKNKQQKRRTQIESRIDYLLKDGKIKLSLIQHRRKQFSFNCQKTIKISKVYPQLITSILNGLICKHSARQKLQQFFHSSFNKTNKGLGEHNQIYVRPLVGFFRQISGNMPKYYNMRGDPSCKLRMLMGNYPIYQFDKYVIKAVNLPKYLFITKILINKNLNNYLNCEFQNTVKLYQYFYEGNQTLFLVTQKYEYTLADLMKNDQIRKNWNQQKILSIFKQILNGLSELKKVGLYQQCKYICQQNIYITSEDIVKVDIFPMCQQWFSGYISNYWIRKLNNYRNYPQIPQFSTIYFLGVLLWRMFKERHPVQRLNDGVPRLTIKASKQTEKLMRRMFTKMRQQRIKYNQLQNTFQNIYKAVTNQSEAPNKENCIIKMLKCLPCFNQDNAKNEQSKPKKVYL